APSWNTPMTLPSPAPLRAGKSFKLPDNITREVKIMSRLVAFLSLPLITVLISSCGEGYPTSQIATSATPPRNDKETIFRQPDKGGEVTNGNNRP
ncbi:MAG: hypothetical protein Q8Q07_03700, partial [Dehalococcoidales bacterium]|nr:hypothetical protein [Dehalococcoidales bacterium]